MRDSKKTKYAQNSIDYMVYSNPGKVRGLLYRYGYTASGNPHHLVAAVKQLIREQGQPFIARLLEVHPDKNAILSSQAGHTSTRRCHACNSDNYNEDNFCNSCGHSNYNGSGDEDSFLDQFSEFSDHKLEQYYRAIVKRSNARPEDRKLAAEVQVVWNELRQRRLLSAEDQNTDREAPTLLKPGLSFNREELLFMGVSFLSGFVMCSVLKK